MHALIINIILQSGLIVNSWTLSSGEDVLWVNITTWPDRLMMRELLFSSRLVWNIGCLSIMRPLPVLHLSTMYRWRKWNRRWKNSSCQTSTPIDIQLCSLLISLKSHKLQCTHPLSKKLVPHLQHGALGVLPLYPLVSEKNRLHFFLMLGRGLCLFCRPLHLHHLCCQTLDRIHMPTV